LRQWEAEGLVKWLGHVDDMPALFRAVDVVTLPSYREGLPRGLIEAGACGRPLITTDAPGCREVVVDGENGFLVPVKDALPWQGRSLAFRTIPLARANGAGGPGAKVLKEFDEKIVIQRTLAVYQELLPHMEFTPQPAFARTVEYDLVFGEARRCVPVYLFTSTFATTLASPMKILMATKSFLPKKGGAEFAVHHLANRFVSLGHEVMVLNSTTGDAAGCNVRRFRTTRSSRARRASATTGCRAF
jgi:hypothetical protein